MKKEFYPESTFGFILMLLWCLVSAVAYIATSDIESTINPLLLCFGIFFVVTLTFSVYRIKNFIELKNKIKTHFKNVLLINLTTLGCWFFVIYPLKFIDPSVLNTVVLATLPIATLLISLFSYRAQRISYLDYFISILLFIGIFFLGIICFEQKTVMPHFALHHLIIAFGSCIASGIFLATNTIYSKKLSNNGFQPFDILAIRFILIMLVSAILSAPAIHKIINFTSIAEIIAIAFLLIIVPQIIFQYALKELEPITISMISPLMPIMIFLIGFFTIKFHPTFLTIMAVSYVCVISVVGSFFRYKNNMKIEGR